MTRKHKLGAILLGSFTIGMGGSAMASTIDMTQLTWNTDNVLLNQTLTEGFASIVYQGTDFTTAETNGRIYYDGVEAGEPGLVAINDGYSSGQGEFDGCIRASAADVCATGFRTGNRFKMQLTDTGSIDLVFNVGTDPDANGLLPNGDAQPNPAGSLYQVFGRAVNLTTQMLDRFTIELGFYNSDGVFELSAENDGLGFAQNLALGPNNVTAFTQYPFGLFGDESTTQNHDIDGFFDDERAGFNLDIGEDVLASNGFYGGDLGYEARFDYWLSQEMAPAGLLWDDDGNEDTDALVMAWFNEDLGMWEALRSIGLDGGNLVATSILDTPEPFDTAAEASSFFESLARSLLNDQTLSLALSTEEHIEDLANLNLNFGILLTDAFQRDSFTLRFTSFAAPAQIPLPASVLFLLAGVGALGAMRRARSSLAAA